MPDVITKLKNSENFRQGNVVIVTPKGVITSMRSTTHDYSNHINSGVIESKYQNRFDDINYYTS